MALEWKKIVTAPVAIADGGSGQVTAQAAIDALTAVAGATNEHVLTKDTGTGNAVWKTAAGGGGTWISLTDTDPANYTGSAGLAVVVNAGEDGLEFGSLLAGSGDEYVDRGEPAAADYSETGSKAVLNTDGNWHDLDLSAIVPAGAVAIHIRFTINDNAANSQFRVRKKGNSNIFNLDSALLEVANSYVRGSFIVACDSNRVIEYNGTNVAFASILLTVAGWWLPAGTSNGKVKIDTDATADYIGAAAGDGALRVGAGLAYADGGNFHIQDWRCKVPAEVRYLELNRCILHDRPVPF